MSWIQELMVYGGDLVESIGENFATAYGNALGVADRSETLAQPETNQQREPVKGVNADGRPLVTGQGGSSGQWVTGVSNGVVVVGGIALIAVLVMMKGGR